MSVLLVVFFISELEYKTFCNPIPLSLCKRELLQERITLWFILLIFFSLIYFSVYFFFFFLKNSRYSQIGQEFYIRVSNLYILEMQVNLSE